MAPDLAIVLLVCRRRTTLFGASRSSKRRDTSFVAGVPPAPFSSFGNLGALESNKQLIRRLCE
jgi:hypothetical protein